MWTCANAICISTSFSGGPNCSVNSPQMICISWHWSCSGTVRLRLHRHVRSDQRQRPAVGWPEGGVEARTPLSSAWSSYRHFGLMEHDSWAPAFWRSLVALPLPLQSYCQGNGKRAAHHLVHYHTEMLSGSRDGGFPVLGNHFFLVPLPETVCLLFQNLWFCYLPGKVVVVHSFVLPWKGIYSGDELFYCLDCCHFLPNMIRLALRITSPSSTGSWLIFFFFFF